MLGGKYKLSFGKYGDEEATWAKVEEAAVAGTKLQNEKLHFLLH
jgi:hypothetical protein